MTLSIGKKLTFSFLILAVLVFLSGTGGIIILNKVSRSADMVAKEKVPVQYSVLQANLAVEGIQKTIGDYIHSASNLEQKETKLLAYLDEFDMWISMLEYGTSSDQFKKSGAYKVYKNLGLDISVPKSSRDMLTEINIISKQGAIFRQGCIDLVKAQNDYLTYSYDADGQNYDLPSYLLILRQYQTEWFNSLESVVVSVTKFEKNVDPVKGPMRTWINTYKLNDDGFNKLLGQLDKYHIKLLETAVKINEQPDFEAKDQLLKRNRGNFARINKFLNDINDYISLPFQTLRTTKAEKYSDLAASGNIIGTELEKLVKSAKNEMAIALKNSESTQKSGTIFLIVLTFVAVLIAGGLGFYISRYLTKSIRSLADVTKLIAQGDLKNKVSVSSNDELGNLASDTNAMTDNLRKIISKITEYSSQLTKSSSDLTGLASSLSKGAQNMTGKSQSVAAAAEEMSANMNSVAATSEQAATNINTVSIATDEINSSINEIAKNSESGSSITQEAVQRVNSATKRVNELGAAAKEISKVTETISDISAQTNLLALNATIEAARAGEAGKGFAVVASEIKQLALQTAGATNDIKQRIESIQNSTSDTIKEIESVSTIIVSVNDIVSAIAAAVEEQSATTKEISENMGQASSGLAEVNENVAQSTSVSREIAKDINDVSHSSNDVLKNSDLVSICSGELKTLASSLQELVDQFKL